MASGAVVVSALLVLGLSACTSGSRVAEGTSLRVALDAPFTSYNPNTGHGSASDANASVVAATNSSFASWDAGGELVFDESFGTIEKIAEDPLTVRYTIADGVRWSDGVEVDAADLMLAWAANSRTLNDSDFDPTQHIDPETGRFAEDLPDGVVHFDGFTANALHLVTETPETADRSITLRFDEYVADWAAVFTVGVPAHIVGRQALDSDADAEQAKRLVMDAIVARDTDVLAAISRSWNSDFVIEQGAGNDEDEGEIELLVGNGPYTISRVQEGGVTLVANPRYRGEHRPRFETVEVMHISDPLEAVAAVDRGEVDVLSPQPSSDVLAALAELDVDRDVTHSGVWELLQVRFAESANGTLHDAEVREAFLASVPRSQLVDDAGVRRASAAPRDSFVTMPGAAGYEESLQASRESRIEHSPGTAKRMLATTVAEGRVSAAPTVCILFDPANPRRVAQFSAIRDAAASAGFTVTDCSSPDWRNLLGTQGTWDAALYGLRDRTMAVQAVTAMFRSDSPLNHARFASDDVDQVLAQLDRAESDDERASLRAQLDTMLWQQGWGLPLLQVPSVTVSAEHVDGVVPSPYAHSVLHDVWRWAPAPDSAS